MSSVRYGTRIGDLKNKQSTHTRGMGSVRYGTRLGDLKNKQPTHTVTPFYFKTPAGRGLGMSEDHDRCFSILVLGAFSTGVFNTNALPRINIGADVWGESSIMTGVCHG